MEINAVKRHYNLRNNNKKKKSSTSIGVSSAEKRSGKKAKDSGDDKVLNRSKISSKKSRKKKGKKGKDAIVQIVTCPIAIEPDKKEEEDAVEQLPSIELDSGNKKRKHEGDDDTEPETEENIASSLKKAKKEIVLQRKEAEEHIEPASMMERYRAAMVLGGVGDAIGIVFV